MGRTAKTFSHEQLARWLNQGFDMAKIGFGVIDENEWVDTSGQHAEPGIGF